MWSFLINATYTSGDIQNPYFKWLYPWLDCEQHKKASVATLVNEYGMVCPLFQNDVTIFFCLYLGESFVWQLLSNQNGSSSNFNSNSTSSVPWILRESSKLASQKSKMVNLDFKDLVSTYFPTLTLQIHSWQLQCKWTPNVPMNVHDFPPLNSGKRYYYHWCDQANICPSWWVIKRKVN